MILSVFHYKYMVRSLLYRGVCSLKQTNENEFKILKYRFLHCISTYLPCSIRSVLTELRAPHFRLFWNIKQYVLSLGTWLANQVPDVISKCAWFFLSENSPQLGRTFACFRRKIRFLFRHKKYVPFPGCILFPLGEHFLWLGWNFACFCRKIRFLFRHKKYVFIQAFSCKGVWFHLGEHFLQLGRSFDCFCRKFVFFSGTNNTFSFRLSLARVKKIRYFFRTLTSVSQKYVLFSGH